jgi:hypothetical protein
MSLREKILAAEDIQSEIVDVPEWNVKVEVRGMNGSDRSRILDSAAAAGSSGLSVGAMYVDTVIATVYDPDSGLRIFSDADRDALLGKSASAIDRLAEVGMRLSGMSVEAQDNAKKRFPEESAS